jgi:hypothetical protein
MVVRRLNIDGPTDLGGHKTHPSARVFPWAYAKENFTILDTGMIMES